MLGKLKVCLRCKDGYKLMENTVWKFQSQQKENSAGET